MKNKTVNLVTVIFLFILGGCAGSSKSKSQIQSDEDISWIKDKDFNKVEEIPYIMVDDYYDAGSDSKEISNISDEGVQSLPKSEVRSLPVSKSSGPIGGLIRCYRGEYEEGISEIVSHYRAYKNNPLYYNSLGTCFVLQNEIGKAVAFYNLALKIKPNFFPAINNLGVVYYRSGEYSKAFSAFSKAMQNAKRAKTPTYNLAILYLKYNLFHEFREIPYNYRNNDLYLFGNALFNFENGNYEKSLKVLEKIKVKEKFSPAYELNQAAAYVGLEKNEYARNVLSRMEPPSDAKLFENFQKLQNLVGEE